MGNQRQPKAPDRPRPGGARYLAQTHLGLEEVLAAELRELGAGSVESLPGGATFAGHPALACRATLWLRSATRVLEPVAEGSVATADDLYELAGAAAWEELVGADRTFSVRVSLNRAGFRDAQFAALRVKDAIVDRVRQRRGRRPSVGRRHPDVPVRVIVRGEHARLFRDLAGTSLHRRGHRPVQIRSPLPESLAAGLLQLAGWDRSSPLVDPMCGSGTFVLEAAALASDRAPGLGRAFAAERFPNADPALWRRLREEARARAKPGLDVPLHGSDRHPGAVDIARGAARAAGLAHLVRFEVADLARSEPPFPPAIVVANPPWGERLGRDRELVDSWRALGTFLRRCPGAAAFVLSGNPQLTRHLGLKATRRWALRLARFDLRWLRYDMRPGPAAAAG